MKGSDAAVVALADIVDREINVYFRNLRTIRRRPYELSDHPITRPDVEDRERVRDKNLPLAIVKGDADRTANRPRLGPRRR